MKKSYEIGFGSSHQKSTVGDQTKKKRLYKPCSPWRKQCAKIKGQRKTPCIRTGLGRRKTTTSKKIAAHLRVRKPNSRVQPKQTEYLESSSVLADHKMATSVCDSIDKMSVQRAKNSFLFPSSDVMLFFSELSQY